MRSAHDDIKSLYSIIGWVEENQPLIPRFRGRLQCVIFWRLLAFLSPHSSSLYLPVLSTSVISLNPALTPAILARRSSVYVKITKACIRYTVTSTGVKLRSAMCVAEVRMWSI